MVLSDRRLVATGGEQLGSFEGSLLYINIFSESIPINTIVKNNINNYNTKLNSIILIVH